MELTNIAETVMGKRYLRIKEDGTKETPDEMLRRVARVVAEGAYQYGHDDKYVKELEEEFYKLMDNQDFMPNSPTFTGAGTELGMMSACFVQPVDDSIESIYETMKNSAKIFKTGGGVGYSFSRLRPANDKVKSSNGISSGPISFMEIYDTSVNSIKQGGTRRGAQMGILRVDHPDILDFIKVKQDTTKLNNFNVSVAITDKFMEALENNGEYDLINPRDNQITGTLKASDVWNLLVECAWKTAEPGIIFIDRMNQLNPNNHCEVIEATNPCGEQPLPPHGSCNLSSINLANFVLNPYTDEAKVDWDRLAEVTRWVTLFLDQVIDVNKYPLPEIDEEAKKTRRIGLGVMGFAEMLVQLKTPYNSTKAIEIAGDIMFHINTCSIGMSVEIAKDRGTYPVWNGSRWEKNGFAVRNSTLTMVAPNGTTSLFAAKPNMSVSGGIEPKFALVFVRNQAGSKMLDVDGQFSTIAKKEGWYSEELMERVAQLGSCKNVDGVPEEWQNIFVTSQEVEPEWHVKIQAAFQKHVQAAISKTCNFANDATRKDVDKAYRMAWDLGLKGITVYRDGCRIDQVLSTGTKKEEEKSSAPKPTLASNNPKDHLRQRLTEFKSQGFVVPTYFGNMTIDVHMDENDEPYEVMVNVGAVGSDLMADAVGMGMLVSRILRMNSSMSTKMKVDMVIDTLKNIGGSTSYGFGVNRITSLASAIAKGLQRFVEWQNQDEKTEVATENHIEQHQQQKHELCPECGNYTYVSMEGCGSCVNCGYSACK